MSGWVNRAFRVVSASGRRTARAVFCRTPSEPCNEWNAGEPVPGRGDGRAPRRRGPAPQDPAGGTPVACRPATGRGMKQRRRVAGDGRSAVTAAAFRSSRIPAWPVCDDGSPGGVRPCFVPEPSGSRAAACRALPASGPGHPAGRCAAARSTSPATAVSRGLARRMWQPPGVVDPAGSSLSYGKVLRRYGSASTFPQSSASYMAPCTRRCAATSAGPPARSPVRPHTAMRPSA